MTSHRPLTVYLIRHGETQWNREGRCQGGTDIPLTAKGYQQAHAIAKALAGTSFSTILSSPLQRSRETAAILATSQNLEVETCPELQEWDQGSLEGLSGPELLSQHQTYFQRWFSDPAGAAPPQGEPLQAVQARAWPVIDRLRERSLQTPVAVVSHTMTIATIICAALNLDLRHIHRLKLDIASKTTLTFTSFGLFSAWVLTSLNDCHHLQTDLH
ncbi:MAG: histidine phosphatase family protein [Candidatus Binatia bacterium]